MANAEAFRQIATKLDQIRELIRECQTLSASAGINFVIDLEQLMPKEEDDSWCSSSEWVSSSADC